MKIRLLVDCHLNNVPAFKAGDIEVLTNDLAQLLIERGQAEACVEDSPKAKKASKTPDKA